MLKQASRRWQVIVATVLMLPLMLYALLCFQRPPRLPSQQPLFPGIYYQREVYASPRPYIVHRITVDLTTPGLRAFVTPGTTVEGTGETTARTTSQFLQEFGLQLAINANFFYPFREEAPWNFYPHVGDRVRVLGQSVSNGNSYAPAQANWAALCISPDNHARIVATGPCPADTAQAVAGQALSLSSRPSESPHQRANADPPYSRTAVAVNAAGTTLWIVIIDGKQPLYSEGVTLAELRDILMPLGVDSALNLDGGGSTTLVVQTGSKPAILNAPLHAKIPLWERPVANHLGFYARR